MVHVGGSGRARRLGTHPGRDLCAWMDSGVGQREVYWRSTRPERKVINWSFGGFRDPFCKVKM